MHEAVHLRQQHAEVARLPRAGHLRGALALTLTVTVTLTLALTLTLTLTVTLTICEVLAAAASTASSEWCDQNCLAKPATDSCKATCKCPRGTHGAKPEPSPDPEPKEEAKEEAKARPQSVVALLAAHAPLASTQSWLQRFLFLSQFEQVRLM